MFVVHVLVSASPEIHEPQAAHKREFRVLLKHEDIQAIHRSIQGY